MDGDEKLMFNFAWPKLLKILSHLPARTLISQQHNGASLMFICCVIFEIELLCLFSPGMKLQH